MGTRHLICVFFQGKWVVAQYGQYDGYAEGQGVKIFRFLSVARNIEDLKAGLAHVYEVTEDNISEINTVTQEWEEAKRQELGLAFAYMLDPSSRPYPSLSRDASSKLLGMIAALGKEDAEAEGQGETTEAGQPEPKKKGPIPVQLSLEFANDTLFCEWAYVIDLDTEVLEVYAGGERKHDGHRFKDVGIETDRVPRFGCSIPFKELYLMSTESEFLDRVKAGFPTNTDGEGDENGGEDAD